MDYSPRKPWKQVKKAPVEPEHKPRRPSAELKRAMKNVELIERADDEIYVLECIVINITTSKATNPVQRDLDMAEYVSISNKVIESLKILSDRFRFYATPDLKLRLDNLYKKFEVLFLNFQTEWSEGEWEQYWGLLGGGQSGREGLFEDLQCIAQYDNASCLPRLSSSQDAALLAQRCNGESKCLVLQHACQCMELKTVR